MSNQLMIFMAGTGTDVGKTVATAALLRALSQQGKDVFGIKPLQTGCPALPDGTLTSPDVQLYEEACPQGCHSALFCFRPACSPHLAAQQAGMSFTARQLAKNICCKAKNYPPSSVGCIEGSGGIMVPINRNETLLDVMIALNIPALLVCPNQLGTINHSLLSWHAFQTSGIHTLGFILTPVQHGPATADGNTVADAQHIKTDNRTILEQFSGLPCLGELPLLENLNDEDPCLRQKDWDKAAGSLAPAVKALLQYCA